MEERTSIEYLFNTMKVVTQYTKRDGQCLFIYKRTKKEKRHRLLVEHDSVGFNERQLLLTIRIRDHIEAILVQLENGLVVRGVRSPIGT